MSAERADAAVSAPEVVVRRSAVVLVGVTVTCAIVAGAYLWRFAAGTGRLGALDVLIGVVLAAVAVVGLWALADSRTPLLVADDLGVRIRLGGQWRGLPWEAVDQVVCTPRRRPWQDGRLLVVPRHLGRVLEGLDGPAQRQAARNQRRHGSALGVPLGVATRVKPADLLGTLEAHAGGRTPVLAVGSGGAEQLPRELRSARPVEPLVAMPVPVAAPLPEPQPVGPVRPVRPLRQARRVEVTRNVVDAAHPRLTAGATALASVPAEESVRLRLPEEQALVPRPTGLFFDPAPAVVSEAYAEETAQPDRVPALVPPDSTEAVIGPELALARNRLGLSLDDLSERTRIRPHVIEAIEADDFVPCGGDVYARGHLRTLAQVLGRDPEPLLALHAQRYASAPVSARRVFEAELAAGPAGSFRSTVGAASWTLVAGVVVTLVLVWGVLRLVTGGAADSDDPPMLPPDGVSGLYQP